MAIKKNSGILLSLSLTFHFLLLPKSLSHDRHSAWHRRRAEKCIEHAHKMLRLEGRQGSKGRGRADKDLMRVFVTQVMKERLRSVDAVDKEGVVRGGW